MEDKEHEPIHIHAVFGSIIEELPVIPRIKSIKPVQGYCLQVVFDDGKECLYDVNSDIDTIKGYDALKKISELFEQVQLDESRTCVYWNDYIDLPSDAIYEYGGEIIQ